MTPFDSAWPDLLVTLVAAAGIAVIVGQLVRLVIRRPARQYPVVADMSRRGHRPFQAALVLGAVALVLNQFAVGEPVPGWVARLVQLALIGVIGWLVAVLAFVVEDLALSRYRIDVRDNRRARRVRTQVSILRRLTVAVVVIIASASMLLTFPSVQTVGASLLASAGLISVVAGLAAQTSLANVFAGLQLAFTDALRVDDVVVVEQEWGRVEEITLTYVVVHIWDDRRLVLPSTWFTTTPFENWTRRNSDVLGTVEFDLDWTTPFDAMREQLTRIVARTPLWDGRIAILQVTDAVGSYVRARVLVSGADGPTVFDLRCYVRESLVRWLQAEHAAALPRLRTDVASRSRRAGTGAAQPPPERSDDTSAANLFTTPEGLSRYRMFTGGGDADPEDDRTRVAVEELALLDGVDADTLPWASRQPQQPG